jgi:hypothetical protein
MLLERRTTGDEGRATELLGLAVRAYRSLGMPRHAALTEISLSRGTP